ncbi:glycosyltransferase [Billgrantia azerbaijanica]|nr:glycosyltransferase [Halomonas azerbaijanica]
MSQPITAIHQFHHGVDVGDGVTNSMLFIQRLLRERGFESEIFAARIPEPLEGRVRSHRHLEGCDPDATLLLQHHSLGHSLGDWLRGLGLPRALVYHNITPPGYFSEGSELRHYAELGREQLRDWRDDFRAVLAVSDYNAEDLQGEGYAPDAIRVIPLLVDLARLDGPVASDVSLAKQLHPELGHRPALSFVGRLVENKRQHLLIEMLWHLQHMLPARAPRPMLVLAGGGKDSEYARFLKHRLHQLRLDDSVVMPGKVDDATLAGLYRGSAAFVCASAHEGFGMPLVEAMLADCPVVAMGLTNIPHTLGEGGLVLDSEDPAVMAAAVALLLEDPALADTVRAGQQRTLARYQPDTLKEALRDWLVQACGAPPM